MTTFTWLPDAAWRGALLLALAFVIARLLRSQPAAVRHVLWAGALAGVMAMPILAAVAPLRVPVTVPRRFLAAPDVKDQAATLDADHLASTTEHRPINAARLPAAEASPDASPVTSPSTGSALASSLTPVKVAALVWLLGTTLLGLRLLVGFLALRRLRRNATAVDDPDVLDLVSDCAGRIGTHTTPCLLASPSVAMPCTAGWLRPVVVLPDEYTDWTRERLEVVLLHELGHIRRMDIVPHLLGEVARVVYWFNPLVWLAASRLRAEAESATDDRVVHAGARPSDYADHLLDIVIQARKAWHPAPLIPLARRSEFEGRILSILESGGRALPSARRAAGVVVLVAGLSLGVASMSGATAAKAPDADPTAVASDTSNALPDDEADRSEPQDPTATGPDERQSVQRATTVGALAEALRDPVAAVRQAAAQALGNARDSAAVRALIEVLRSDESALVRRSAAWSLGEIADAAAIPVLSEAVTRDRDAEVRKNAASALGSIDDPRATPALTQALERDAEVSVRIQAAESLANIEDPASINALIRALDRDDDRDVRRAVINAIDNLEDARALPAVSRALRDADAEVRRAAADALGSMDDREAVPALLAAARDANAQVRHDVINALSNLADRRAIPAFVTALSDADVEVRRAAAEGFNNVDNVRAAPPELLRALDDADAEVRHAAAHALGHIGDPEAVRPLIARIADANVEVRRAVVDALDEFDDPAVTETLRTALKDSDPEVRESAARALGNRSRSK